MKNIFVFVGSRKGKKSNTYIIISRILDCLKSKTQEQINIDIVTPASDEIKQCMGCGNCFMLGECSLDQNDMMSVLKRKITNADMLIISSGVYLHNVSSDCKNFLDRIGIWTHTFELAGKTAITITTSTSNGNDIVNGYLYKILQCMGANVVANIGIKLFGNNPVEYPDDQLISRYADIVKENLDADNHLNISSQQEQLFQNMKEIMKNNNTSYDAHIWREKGYLECANFVDLIERKRNEDNSK